MTLLIALAVAILCAWASAKIAREKGRNAENWAAAGFFFGLIGLIVIAALPPTTPKGGHDGA